MTKIQFIDPATDFSDGLAVIRSYHEDLLRQGRTLLDLVDEIDARGLDADRAHRLVRVYVHYQRATLLHHQDEEQVLFPAVVGRDLMIDGMIERLALDHEEIEEAWRVLETAFREMLERRRVPDQLPKKARRFEKLLREHLLRENEDFLPRMERILSAQRCQALGKAMAHRRSHKTKL